MKKVFVIVLVLCFFVACEEKATVNETQSNTSFERVYFFYKPGCHACDKVKPIVKNASKKINIIFCNVEKMNEDCMNVSKKINLHAVPTMAVLDEKCKTYVGSDKIIEFLKKL